MEYRKLPHGDEQISILGLGTSSIGMAGDQLACGHYDELEKKAGGCVKCGHCDKRCPFQVSQVARMNEICAYFGR